MWASATTVLFFFSVGNNPCVVPRNSKGGSPLPARKDNPSGSSTQRPLHKGARQVHRKPPHPTQLTKTIGPLAVKGVGIFAENDWGIFCRQLNFKPLFVSSHRFAILTVRVGGLGNPFYKAKQNGRALRPDLIFNLYT